MCNSQGYTIDSPSSMLAFGDELTARAGDRWSMLGPAPNEPPAKGDPFAIGARRSWVPALGKIVWEVPKGNELRGYYAYICEASGSQQIGYVRVPDYDPNQDALKGFEEVITRFESTTEAMVFDQVSNRGGNMFQMYALLEMLTDKAMALPTHQITIDDDYAAVLADDVANAEAGEKVPPERVAYARLVLSEKAAGRGTGLKPSNPLYLEGVAQILPAKNHYTKKIVVLINELDFSAAEFLAAILQDNKRATLFGQTTAGAGGCQKRISKPNDLGIADISWTWTIARRTNGEYIENKGIQPDVKYELTVEDIRSGFGGYRQALLATINA